MERMLANRTGGTSGSTLHFTLVTQFKDKNQCCGSGSGVFLTPGSCKFSQIARGTVLNFDKRAQITFGAVAIGNLISFGIY